MEFRWTVAGRDCEEIPRWRALHHAKGCTSDREIPLVIPWCPGGFRGFRGFGKSPRSTSSLTVRARIQVILMRGELVALMEQERSGTGPFFASQSFPSEGRSLCFQMQSCGPRFWAHTLTAQFRDPAPCSQLVAWPAVPVRSSGRTNSVVSSMVTDGGTGILRPKERKRHPGSGCLQSAMRPLALFHHWGVPDIAAS